MHAFQSYIWYGMIGIRFPPRMIARAMLATLRASPSEQSIRLQRGYGMRRPAGAPAANGLLERDRRSFAHSSYEHRITVERYLRATRCNAARGSRGHRLAVKPNRN